MFEEEELFPERNEFNFESRLIRNDSKNIYNRLRSIKDDAEFVMKVADLYSNLALIANERCGSWYIDRTKKKAYSAYFKSTDGHMHIWDFSIRRNNLHLIPVLMEHSGGIIVDSTRKGKRIPDALSKTIPIWCCTLNRAVAKYRGYHHSDALNDSNGWDTTFHSLPSIISRSEHAQIEARIDGFVDKLLSSGIDIHKLSRELKKPLRPIWYTPQSYDALMESPPDFDDEHISFCPVVCLSASEAVETGYERRNGYLYVQGSGDDQESWAMGLTAMIFWKHHDEILASAAKCEDNVRRIVSLSKSKSAFEDIGEKNFAFIGTTGLAIGNFISGKPSDCWLAFDYVINCSEEKYECMDESKKDCFLHLRIPEGKKGQIIFAQSIQKAIDFVYKPIVEGKKVLIHGQKGKDYSVGILLSIILHYYDIQGQLSLDRKPHVDKKTVQHQLVQIISFWEKASPSRTTLKRINTHFMSPSVGK